MDEYISKPIQIFEVLFNTLENLTHKSKNETPDYVVMTEDGKIVFSFDTTDPAAPHNRETILEIAKYIELIGLEVEGDDIIRVEAIAKDIKKKRRY